jgi:hypothetical protein
VSTTDLVLLRGGFSTPAGPYLLLIDLEARGISVTRDGADLLVGPPDRLTPGDDRALRAWKADLLRLLDYLARPDLDAHLFHDHADQATDRKPA